MRKFDDGIILFVIYREQPTRWRVRIRDGGEWKRERYSIYRGGVWMWIQLRWDPEKKSPKLKVYFGDRVFGERVGA